MMHMIHVDCHVLASWFYLRVGVGQSLDGSYCVVHYLACRICAMEEG